LESKLTEFPRLKKSFLIQGFGRLSISRKKKAKQIKKFGPSSEKKIDWHGGPLLKFKNKK